MNRENIPDDELIRRLDGELTGAARAELDAHLAAAPEGHARLQLLHKRSDRLSELLRELNPEPEQVSRSAHTLRPEVERAATRARVFTMTPAMKAAAIVVLLLSTALAVPPVRAWIIERVVAAAQVLGLREPAPASAPSPTTEPAPIAPEAAVAYSFAIESDTLDLYLAPTAGQLIVRREERALASAQVSGADAQVTVLGSRLRIEGASVATARYEILLPTHVRTLRLQQVAGSIRAYDVPAAGQDLHIDLATVMR